jgi:UDP-glucose 4-epimerase
MARQVVVVTGSSGFVASHTIPALKQAGYDVIGFDLKENELTTAIGDVCSYDEIAAAIAPGYKVLHLAAVARFAACDERPSEAYRTNVGGVATLLAAAKARGAERVVLASTGSVYMPVWQVPITEHHPVGGNSHYGYSKALGEKQIGLYPVPFVLLRYAHLYGTNKEHGGLIDSFLSRVTRGMKPILYGGWQSCDFCYIEDIVQANLLALETPHLNEIYNIGTGEESTVEEIFSYLCELTGYTEGVVREQLRTVDAPRFVFSIEKARRLLGYSPKWTFKEGLKDLLQKKGLMP